MVSIESNIITVYQKGVKDQTPRHIELSKVLNGIKTGGSNKKLLEAISSETNKEKRDDLKKTLPCICFSGKFNGTREDKNLILHSGLFILDIDNLSETEMIDKQKLFIALPYAVAVFVSPSGNGLKVLVRIKDTKKHREHYLAIMEEIQGLDSKNINEGRVCFFSYDPNIYINYNATEYSKIKEVTTYTHKVANTLPENAPISKLERWLQKKNNVFAVGNRNNYIYILAGACCRFGIPIDELNDYINKNYLVHDSSLKMSEVGVTTQSAYKKNQFASASFDKEVLIDKETKKEVIIDLDDGDIADVIRLESVKLDIIRIYDFGYESAESTGILEVDYHFKWKRGEQTLIYGPGNHGKTDWSKFLMLNKSVKDGTKWAIFAPENYPPSEYYHDLTEMLLGDDCTPKNLNKPDSKQFDAALKFIHDHFFYVFPKELAPTPDYIQSRFLELIIKNKIDGCVIDPFNQMENDYKGAGGRDDKYLETFLASNSRFALLNNIYSVIIAHPVKPSTTKDGKPVKLTAYSVAGGAMWSNKMDNIMLYHRPNWNTDRTDRTCEVDFQKIKRQKIVGLPGELGFEFNRNQRRFKFNDYPLKHYSEGATIIETPYESKPITPNLDANIEGKKAPIEYEDTPPF